MEQWQLFLPFFSPLLISPFLSLLLPISPLHVPSAWVIHLSPTQYSTTWARRSPYCHNTYLLNAEDFINVFPHSLLPAFSSFALCLFPSFTYFPFSIDATCSFLASPPFLSPAPSFPSLFFPPLSSEECKNRTGEALSPLSARRLISIFMRGSINYTWDPEGKQRQKNETWTHILTH